jgi:uncharacterized protein (TIGR03437 family)
MRLIILVGLSVVAVSLWAAPPGIQGIGGANSKLAVDSAGNIYVAGIVQGNQLRVAKLSPQGEPLATWVSTTNDYSVLGRAFIDASGNFVVGGLFVGPSVARLDSGLTNLISRIELPGGSTGWDLWIDAIASNAQGNLFVGGWSVGSPGGPCGPCVFVGELTPQANVVMRSSFNAIGSDPCPYLSDPDRCLTWWPAGGAAAEDVAIASDGSVVLVGAPDGWTVNSTMAKMSADLSTVLWQAKFPLNTRIHSLALDSEGNAFVAGEAAGAFIAELDKSGLMISSTHPNSPGIGPIEQIRIDQQGRIWVSGSRSLNYPFPVGPPKGIGGFILEIDPHTFAVLQEYQFQSDVSDFAFRPDGGLVAVSSAGLLYWIGPGSTQQTGIIGLSNLVSYPANEGQVSPGEFIRIVLVSGGPATEAGAVLDQNGRIATILGGVQVKFDGISAPLLHVTPTSIDAAIPFEVAGNPQTTMQVETPNGTLATVMLPVVSSNLQVLAVQNPDGTLNSKANPAPRGSAVSLYLNGAGAYDPPMADGEIAPDGTASPVAPVSISAVIPNGQILFEGSAPGQIAGVLQINVGNITDLVLSGVYLACDGCAGLSVRIY